MTDEQKNTEDQLERADEEAARAAAAAEEAVEAAGEDSPAAAEAVDAAEKAEAAAEAAAAKPKPKRVRKAREAEVAADEAEEAADEAVEEARKTKPARKPRAKPKKAAPTAEEPKAEEPEAAEEAPAEEPVAAEPPAKPASTRRRDQRREVPVGVEVRAHAKYVRTSARKARLVCDHIRGKDVAQARAILAFTPRAAAKDWAKLLESAVANAEHNHELVGEDLKIAAVYADEGPTLKRYRPRAMGRATRIRKRTSHLTITLTPKEL
jgi:large subunit ribosomal protein L22